MKSENFQSNVLSCCQKNTKTQTLLLQKKQKSLECTANYFDNSEYISSKSKLDQFYDEKANGIRIRSKCVGTNKVKNLQSSF